MKLASLFTRMFSQPQSASKPLPKQAKTIFVEWIVKEGGFQASAWTDENGTPFLAVKTLNRIGKTTGLYDWHRTDSFISDMVAGFTNGRALVVRLHLQLNPEGLAFTVSLPPGSKHNFEEKLFVSWGSGEPPMSLTILPTFDHYAVNSFPAISDEGETL